MLPTTIAAAADAPAPPPPEARSVHRRRWLRPFTFLAAVVFSCAALYRAAPPVAPFRLLSWGATWPSAAVDVNHAAAFHQLETEDASLERVLKEAAMENGTVILTTLNSAWASPGSIIDLFLESFRIGEGTSQLLNHLVIVALDHEAYMLCLSIHVHCFALVTKGVDFSGQKNFMTADYLSMMWRRIDFLRTVLEKGYNFIFSDGDIMWFRNPQQHFFPDADFQIACDNFYGDATDLRNKPNGGFNYVKANNRSIEFYKFWYKSREKHPGYHDQDVLNFIKHDPFIKEIGVKIRFLSTEYFGGLCEPSRDFSKVCTMHANCCIGLSRKLCFLGVILDDWRKYMSLSSRRKISHRWSVPKKCRVSFETLTLSTVLLPSVCEHWLWRIGDDMQIHCKQHTSFKKFSSEAKLIGTELIARLFLPHFILKLTTT